MFHINCTHCGHGHLVGLRSITSFVNTNAGPVANFTCPNGHTVFSNFGR